MHKRSLWPLLLGAVLVAAPFFNAAAQATPATTVGAEAFKQATTSWTLTQTGQMVQGQTVTKAISWGSRVRYVGSLVAVPALVSGALFWFYEEAQRQTGTDLDTWWAETGGSPAAGEVRLAAIWRSCGGTCVELQYYRWNTTGGETGSEQRTMVDATVEQKKQAARDYADAACASQSWCAELGGWTTTTDSSTFKIPNSVFAGYEDQRIYGGQETLSQMASDPVVAEALRSQVLPQYADAEAADPLFPSTYADPYGEGELTLSPAPNRNEWYDDELADGSLDSDGDGWPDWMEVELGADPKNQYNVPQPFADPDGDGFTNDQERQAGTNPNDANSRPDDTGQAVDADNDGVADASDPCPSDPWNQCETRPPPDELECGAVACESTQQAVRSELSTQTGVLTEIRDGVDPGFVMPEPATFAAPDLSGLEAYQPDTTPARAPYEVVLARIDSDLDSVWTAAEGKFPFGLGSWVTESIPTTVATGECPSAGISVLGQNYTLDVCSNPLDEWMRTTGRTLIGFLFSLGLIFYIFEIVSRS